MNRGRGGNRGGGGGGRQYVSRGRSPRSADHYVSRGRSPRSADHYVVRRVPDGAAAHSDDASSRNESSRGGRTNSEIASPDGLTKNFDGLSFSDYAHRPNSGPYGSGNFSRNDGSSKPVQNIPETEPKSSNVPSFSPSYDNNFPSLSPPSELDARTPNIIPSYFSCTPSVDAMHKKKEPSLSMDGQFCQEVHNGKTELEGNSGKNEVESSDSQHKGLSFDICEERNRTVPKLKSSLLDKNRAIRNEKRRMQGDTINIIRPGMIHLKGYISLTDQVKLIKSCRDLGLGPGGFYQPGYRDGARLHLKMMCLGKVWDPETSSYVDIRPADQAKPPPIPNEFQQLVKDAIKKSHVYLESDPKVRNARDFLPSMSPDICIVNFYTKQGKLGLHEDKDESERSLGKGIPVVSISIGDSAEFLYGDQKDVDKADTVTLESGDVLIFGGKSRRIFHGVSTINSNTAPKALLEETGFKPGRLNLTFREY